MSSSQETRPPLQTLLAIRRGAEEGAARAWEAATVRRAAAEARQAELDAEVQAAREELRSRRSSATGWGRAAGAPTAALGAARERFWQRLRESIAALADAAGAHRAGQLAAARAGVLEAAAAHRAALAARELMEKVCQTVEGARRRVEARRAEVAADEQAQAVAAKRAVTVGPAAPPSSRGSNPR
jgi:hypothetical protein